MDDASQLQRDYYARTASDYDAMHLNEHDAHFAALDHIAAYARQRGVARILDVGAGTGRAMAYLAEALPDVELHGVEPVAELVAIGHSKGLPADRLQVGDGYALAYEDGAFEFVIETGMLHHVKEPARVVAEMTRVARRGVFLSDANRFGQGRLAVRAVKLGLWAVGLWPAANLIKTRGKGYLISEGDGLSYSYSVYDDLRQLAAWADQVIVVPLEESERLRRSPLGLAGPILTASHVLACALRET